MGDAGARCGEALDVALGKPDAVGAPDVAREPAELLQILGRPAAVEAAAVLLLLDGLGEVGVQREAQAPGEDGRLRHQPPGDRERRAWGNGDLDARAGPALVQGRREPLGVCEHRVDVLDEVVGRQPAVRDAKVHGAARRDEPQPDLARRLHLGLDQTVAPAREEVVVVEDRRTA